MTLAKRASALALALALTAGNAAVCAGWMSSPEARMACCSEGGACPLHAGNSEDGGSHSVTQSQADNCCAESERESTNQPNLTFVAAISSAVLGSGVVVPNRVPAFVLSDGWRSSMPIPTALPPKHLLLSVFLV